MMKGQPSTWRSFERDGLWSNGPNVECYEHEPAADAQRLRSA